MASLFDRLTGRAITREDYGIPDGRDVWYPRMTGSRPVDGKWEVTATDMDSMTEKIYKGNGPTFSLIAVRMLLFSEARFQWQRMNGGRPGDLYGNQDLSILEHPWRGGTTRDLLARAELDVSLNGNSFTYYDKDNDRLRRLRPDWVTIIWGSQSDGDFNGDELDGELVGYLYTPRVAGAMGDPRGNRGTFLLPDEVAHYAPYPDPQMHGRGMSWITPVIRDIKADDSATTHMESFFRNGAISQLAVRVDPSVGKEDFAALVQMMDEEHAGPWNAYKTLYVGGGADPVPMTMSPKDLDFHTVQGGGETRLAAAAGVPVTIVGFSEGLAGSALNAGNYQQTRRRMADGTLRPLWGSFAGSLETICPPPDDKSRLWYDDRDIAFLRDDDKDAAEIISVRATTARTLTDAGFEPDAAIEAAASGDLTVLVGKHTGLFSVQLQPPSSGTTEIYNAEEQGEAPPDIAPPPPKGAVAPTEPAAPANESETQNG